jgi:hypothetical protein
MTRTTRLASAGAAACLLSVMAAPAALAQTTADYTGTGDTVVGGVVTAPGTAAPRPAAAPGTLPFTGGEVVLIAAAGAAAVAAGAAMVVGGRRRAGADS